MQPNREAYQPAAEQLGSLAGTATPEVLLGISEEVLAVGRLLGREPRLRRALADPARAGEERVGLLGSVLSGKISDDVLALVSALVTGRWPTASNLLDAVERLGVDAVLASAERADELAEVEDELFRFAQVVDGSPELAAVLGDPMAPLERRESLVDDLLGFRPAASGAEGAGATGSGGAKAHIVTVRLIKVALTGFGGRGFAASLSRLVEMTAARRERQVAYVVSAVPLTDQEEARLGARLAQMYGREVSLKIIIDPKIIGGLSVQVGSDLYDGTVLRRLTEIRGALAK